MGRPTRRRAVLIGAIGAAALVVAALAVGLGWRRVVAEWRMRALEQARTEQEAFPILEALAVDAGKDPGLAESFAARLGPARQWATYWFCEYLRGIGRRHRDRPADHLGGLLPLIRSFTTRAQGSPDAVRQWTHYCFWRSSLLRARPELGEHSSRAAHFIVPPWEG